ncbi:C39 family peptidase [Catellatospora sp. KI3]|uniref:C39 family peptidase n=1 Tax=Catellatospora sp. KI3 TaxID=3041620 RepID=UPI002482E29B|nr:C39 family peptidase [Catellatospora sp. KI3]MDI1461246.1 C39 family peptidase [Catellatospora sp. KI3]
MAHTLRRGALATLLSVAAAATIGLTSVDTAHAATARTLTTYSFQAQQTGYWCGPAATRLALTQRGYAPSQSSLASKLPTDTAGTDSITQVMRVLNSYANVNGWYEHKVVNSNSAAEQNLLKYDIVFDVDRNYALVLNVRGGRTDTAGVYHNYPGGHYLTVVGYTNSGAYAVIEDVALGSGHRYTMSLANLSWWVWSTTGYTA